MMKNLEIENIKFESATIDDFKNLAPIVIEFDKIIKIEHQNPPPTPKEIQRSKWYLRKYLVDKKCVYLIAKKSEKIIAFSFVSLDDKNASLGFINELFVIPEERKNGIAKKLIELSAIWLKEKKCGKLQLTVNRKNESAIKLYNKVGFALYEGEYLDMRLEL